MKTDLLKIVLSALLLVVAIAVEHIFNLQVWQLLLVYLPAYILISYEVFHEAAENIVEGYFFDENLLMCIATLGALAIGFLPEAEPQFAEAVFVMLFFSVGELFEHYAEDRSEKSISHLMDIRPDIAHLVVNDDVKDIDPNKVNIGDIVLCRVGDKIPLDGQVVEGSSTLNTVALTGESMPREITVGDEVLSGCINLSGVIKYA